MQCGQIIIGSMHAVSSMLWRTVQGRAKARELNICIKCIEKIDQCSSKRSCIKCKKKNHHTITDNGSYDKSNTVLSATDMVRIQDGLLIDLGSFITENVVQKLPKQKIAAESTNIEKSTGKTNLKIQSHFESVFRQYSYI